MPFHLPPITRRRFLAGSLAAGAAALSPRCLAAAEAPADPDYFVLMADTHLMGRRKDERHGVKPVPAFEQAVNDILALRKRPAGLIVAGDCAHEDAAGYVTLQKLLKPLRQAGLSIHLTIGNHDIRDKFQAAFPDMKFHPIVQENEKTPSKLASVWETPQANWFLLDSVVRPKIQTGEFGAAQLAWLANALDARPDKPALIVAHHQLDPLSKFNGLHDTPAFLKVVLRRKQVKAYFYGHTHIWGMTELSHIHVVNLPVMAWRFDATQPRGFVTLRLRPDGATLALRTLDHKDVRNGRKFELAWRK
jgi:3',5'-cyclic-AMP phosphodiesterase